jgi:hypothetical protein
MKYLLLAAIALTGCTTVSPVQGPSGSAYVVQCRQSSWAACYDAAAAQCPNGYTTTNQTTHLLEKNSMLVQCKHN